MSPSKEIYSYSSVKKKCDSWQGSSYYLNGELLISRMVLASQLSTKKLCKNHHHAMISGSSKCLVQTSSLRCCYHSRAGFLPMALSDLLGWIIHVVGAA